MKPATKARPSRAATTIAAALLISAATSCVESNEALPNGGPDLTAEQASPQEGKADGINVPPVSYDADRCRYDPADPFSPGARLLKGPFAGDCLETRTSRPLEVLAAPTQDSSLLRVANFLHDDAYWVANIPTEAATDAYFQLEYFPAVVPAGHVQLRVRFDEPIVLVGHSSWNEGERHTIDDLVISVDAVPRVGDKYDLFNGTQDHFGLVLEMMSLHSKYEWMVVTQEHHVEQWRLQLTEEELRDLLVFYAHESEAIGLTETYHTLVRNCSTELIGSLDAVVEYTVGEEVKRFLVGVTEMYPNIVRAALIARGLLPLDQSTDWHPLADDPTYTHH